MKLCEYCEAELVRRDSETLRVWAARRYCSRGCASMANIEGAERASREGAMTYEEIAIKLGLTVNQVRGAEFTGMRKLRHNRAAMKLWSIVRAA
jgi:hypothetical protein